MKLMPAAMQGAALVTKPHEIFSLNQGISFSLSLILMIGKNSMVGILYFHCWQHHFSVALSPWVALHRFVVLGCFSLHVLC